MEQLRGHKKVAADSGPKERVEERERSRIPLT